MGTMSPRPPDYVFIILERCLLAKKIMETHITIMHFRYYLSCIFISWCLIGKQTFISISWYTLICTYYIGTYHQNNDHGNTKQGQYKVIFPNYV